MAKDRRANAVLFGFDFQVNAAVVLMLENVMDFETIKLEGNYEDIELQLTNGEHILAQAKAVEKSSIDFKNVRKNLKNALISLSEGASKVNANQLILITNSPNPLNEATSKSLFYGNAHREYSTLPPSSQAIINNYLSDISNPLDPEKFVIKVFPFETDNERERYKAVKGMVDDFIGDLDLNISGLGKKLLLMWQNDVFQNGTKKDATIKLSKKDIMWSIIVIATEPSICDDKFTEYFDTALYNEITHQYRDIIDSCCERFEFFIKVLHDYNNYNSTKKQSERCIDFALTQWNNYIDELKIENAAEEVQKGLIQIVLYSIIRNRITIDKVKKGVNL